MNTGMKTDCEGSNTEATILGSRTRRAAGVVAVVVIMVATLTGCLSKNQISVQKQINDSRVSASLPRLADYSPADVKAQNWAEHLARIGRLEHSNLASGYRAGSWCGLAENVGMGPSVAGLHGAFLNSAGHRANIMNRSYTHMGTGVAKSGPYYFVVHEFVNLC